MKPVLVKTGNGNPSLSLRAFEESAAIPTHTVGQAFHPSLKNILKYFPKKEGFYEFIIVYNIKF